jgi:hypothetical protein
LKHGYDYSNVAKLLFVIIILNFCGYQKVVAICPIRLFALQIMKSKKQSIMETNRRFESYPLWIVVLSNLVSLSIYGLGFFVMFTWGLIFAVAYLFFVGTLEYRLISRHCVDCYYWGKRCGFGRGRLSGVIFKEGDRSKFCKAFSWKNMIPDMLVTLIPLVTGVVLLVIKFNILILLVLVALVLLTTGGNNYIRGKLTCTYCRQRDEGCPAFELFNK